MASRGLGTLTLNLIAKIGGFIGPMDKAARHTDKRMREMERRAYSFGNTIGRSLRSAGAQFLAFAGVTVTVGAAFSAMKGAIDRADNLRDFSIRLGIGTEALSGYAYAAAQTGTDLETLATGFKILAKNATAALNPKSAQAGLFGALGVSKDALTDMTKLIPQVADAFSRMEDGATKAALAQKLFGRSGIELTEFLNSGAAGLDNFAKRAAELGIIISQDTADAADKFNDDLNDLKTAAQGLALKVAQDLLPALDKLVIWARAFVSDAGRVRGVTDNVTAGFQALASVGSVVAGAFTFLQGIRDVLAGIEKQARGMGGVLAAALSFDLQGIKDAANYYKFGIAQADAGLAGRKFKDSRGRDFQNVSSSVSTIRSGPDFGDVAGNARSLAEATQAAKLAKLLGGGGGGGGARKGGGGSKTQGKSDAEREADQLKAAYDRLIASQKEQITLFGATSEAAQMRYDIEFGELAKLSQPQKDALIAGAEKMDQMKAAAALAREEGDLAEEKRHAVAGVLEDLQREADLLGLTNEQRAIYNALQQAGVGISAADTAAITAKVHALYQQGDAMTAQISIMDDFRRGAEDALVAFVTGTKSAGEAIKDFFNDLAAQITRAIAQQWIKQLFGETGSASTGSSGVNWGAIIGSLFGGGKAHGGYVMPGKLYEVGEYDRPEMFMSKGRQYMIPGNAGNVVPIRGGGGVVNNTFLMPSLVTRQTQEQVAQRMAVAGSRATSRNR